MAPLYHQWWRLQRQRPRRQRARLDKTFMSSNVFAFEDFFPPPNALSAPRCDDRLAVGYDRLFPGIQAPQQPQGGDETIDLAASLLTVQLTPNHCCMALQMLKSLSFSDINAEVKQRKRHACNVYSIAYFDGHNTLYDSLDILFLGLIWLHSLETCSRSLRSHTL